MKCRDCKHWRTDSAPYDRNGREFRGCRLTRSHSGEPDNEATLAFGLDYESYSAGLLTTGDFGCVQFEAKE